MNINKINNTYTNQNTAFFGWLPRGENAVWVYMFRNGINSAGTQRLLDNIERNSQRYFVDFDFNGENFLLTAFTNKFKPSENSKVIMSGKIFNRSIKSCLKSMDKFLIKKNNIKKENQFIKTFTKFFPKIREGFKRISKKLFGYDEVSSAFSQLKKMQEPKPFHLSLNAPEPIAGPVPPMPTKSVVPGRSPKQITPEDIITGNFANRTK